MGFSITFNRKKPKQIKTFCCYIFLNDEKYFENKWFLNVRFKDKNNPDLGVEGYFVKGQIYEFACYHHALRHFDEAIENTKDQFGDIKNITVFFEKSKHDVMNIGDIKEYRIKSHYE